MEIPFHSPCPQGYHEGMSGQTPESENFPTPPPETFRVVGIRTDGTRAVLNQGLTRNRANAVKRTLTGLVSFSEILVEPEQSHDFGHA
jgi:hypothetical protein